MDGFVLFVLLGYHFCAHARARLFRFVVAVLTTYPSDISGSIDPVTHKSKHIGKILPLAETSWLQIWLGFLSPLSCLLVLLLCSVT